MQTYEFRLPNGRHIYVEACHFTSIEHARAEAAKRGWRFVCKQTIAL